MPDLSIHDEPLLVDATVAARLLSVSVRTLANLTARSELPCVRIGRALRYSVEDLRHFVLRKNTRSVGAGRLEEPA